MGSPLLFRPRHILWLQKLYRVFRLQELDSIPIQKFVRISCIQKRFRSITQFDSLPQFGFWAKVRKPFFRNGFAQLGDCQPLFRNGFTRFWNREPLFRNSFTQFGNCQPLFRNSFTRLRNREPLIRNGFTQFRQQPCSFSIYIPQTFIKFKL